VAEVLRLENSLVPTRNLEMSAAADFVTGCYSGQLLVLIGKFGGLNRAGRAPGRKLLQSGSHRIPHAGNGV
jgi:hypothetical protein